MTRPIASLRGTKRFIPPPFSWYWPVENSWTMSRVQPPGDPVPFTQPLPYGELKPLFGSGGQVVSDAEMKSSITNGAFVKWLVNVVPVVLSVHVAGSAARLTSFCFRHV